MPATSAQRKWNDCGGLFADGKLTAGQRQDIKRRRAAGERAKDLAAEYHVHRNTVHRISHS